MYGCAAGMWRVACACGRRLQLALWAQLIVGALVLVVASRPPVAEAHLVDFPTRYSPRRLYVRVVSAMCSGLRCTPYGFPLGQVKYRLELVPSRFGGATYSRKDGLLVAPWLLHGMVYRRRYA